MSLCSTSQTSQVLVASHSFGPFFTLRLCCQGLTLVLGSGTCTGSPHWPNGCRRGWSRGEHYTAEMPCNLLGSRAGRDLPVSCGPQRSLELWSFISVWQRVSPAQDPAPRCVWQCIPPSLLPLYPSCTAFPAFGQWELERLILLYANLFYPFLWAETFFSRITFLLVAGIALYLE